VPCLRGAFSESYNGGVIVDLGWTSPIGVAAFFIGAGVFFWLFFNGLEALARAKRLQQGPGEREGSK